LSPKIDPHDLGVKLSHAVDFLCEDMKVKVVLKFRGREMAHTEFGFQLIDKFLKDVAPYGHPDSNPKLLGRAINVMLSPLPRAKRAKNPNEVAEAGSPGKREASAHTGNGAHHPEAKHADQARPHDDDDSGGANRVSPQ
jgi:translation initiation factor IF-3